jgi:hypothetical protein
MLHGRLLAGLAARELERHHFDSGFRLARLTADLFRVTPMAPVELASRRIRAGGRIRVVEVMIRSGGTPVAQVGGLLVATQSSPPGRIWGPPAWDVPAPESLAAPTRSVDADAMGAPDLRFIGPGFEGMGPKRAWLREPWPLVDGEAITPTVQAVMAADVTNPLSNWGEGGLHYINADLTVHLVRSPEGEWIGLDVVDHLAADGVALGRCRLHDGLGTFGHADVTSVAQSLRAG